MVYSADPASQVLVPFRFRQRDQMGRNLGEHPFDLQEDPGGGRAKMPVEHVTMRRMDQHGDSYQAGGEASEHPGLGGMRVHDHGPLPAQYSGNMEEGSKVPDRMDFAGQSWDDIESYSCPFQQSTILFGRAVPSLVRPVTGAAHDDDRLESFLVMPNRGELRVLC